MQLRKLNIHVTYNKTGRRGGNSLFHGVTGEKVKASSIKELAAAAVHKSAKGAPQASDHPGEGAPLSAFDRMDAVTNENLVKLSAA